MERYKKILAIILIFCIFFSQLTLNNVVYAATEDEVAADSGWIDGDSPVEHVDEKCFEDNTDTKTAGYIDDEYSEDSIERPENDPGIFEDAGLYPSIEGIDTDPGLESGEDNEDIIEPVALLDNGGAEDDDVQEDSGQILELSDESATLVSGSCGNSATYELDVETNILTITGSGEITNYSSDSSVPWYNYRNTISKIVINDEITSIGSYAFANLIALSDISCPDTLVNLGKYAFYNCTSLKTIDLPDSVTKIGFKAFANCISLEKINIPLNWKECPSYSSTVNATYCGHIFEGCKNLTMLTVPEGMTGLPSYALAYSDYLETIELPSTLTVVKNHTFYNCTKLKAVDVPVGVTFIGKSAFCYCSSLENVSLKEGIIEIALYAFEGCSLLETVAIPDSVESIGYRTFADCINLTLINIPIAWKVTPSSSTSGTMSVEYCGHIFEGCKNLSFLAIPEGMTEIPAYGLCYSDQLTEIILPSTLTVIKNHTFYRCSNLKTIRIPEGVISIGKSAFCYCNSLTDVTLAEGLKELSLYTFSDCTALADIKLPDSIEKIGWQAFANCVNLSDINIPKNWTETPSSSSSGTLSTEYCGHIFEGCKKLTTLTIPEGMKEIPSFGLCYSDYVTTVNFPDTLTGIKNQGFYGCSKLVSVNIPNSVTAIGKSAFCGCSSLTEVHLPEGLRELSLYTFDGCTSLKSIQLPDTIEKIGYQAFNCCSSLEEINIPINWKECPSSNNVTINSSYCGHIFQGCKSLTVLTLSKEMTSIPAYAFCYSDYIFEINLPDTISKIGKCAFYYCSSLTRINLPSSIHSIDEYAFSNCESLRAINLPKSIPNVGQNVYENCTALAAISIPKSIETIESNAFNGCNNLTHVYYEGSNEQWENIANNSPALSKAIISYGILCDYAEPDIILESSYTKPEGSVFDSFYGGFTNGNHDIIDIEDATFGPNSKNMFVSIPKDSYITYGFKKAMFCPDNTLILITTTGNVNERGDIYVQTLSNELIFIGTVYETSNFHTISLTGVEDYITGIKVVGRDLDGDSPGFDIMNIALVAQTSDKEAQKIGKTRVTLTRNKTTYNLFEEEQNFSTSSNEEATILVSADWNNHSPGKIALVQNSEIILQNSGGAFVDIIPSKLFKANKSIYLVLLDSNNKIIGRRKLCLSISDNLVSRLEGPVQTTRLTVYQSKKIKTINMKLLKMQSL